MEIEGLSSPSLPLSSTKRGRPRKSDIEAKKNRGKVGRPAGDAARIAEFKARLLATSGDRVIEKVIQIAQNDDHPGQMAALKMCIDRILPLSLFEKDVKGGNRAVTINIMGVGETQIHNGPVVEEAEDVDYVETEVNGST